MLADIASIENHCVRLVLRSSINCERLAKNLLFDIGQAVNERPIIPVYAQKACAGRCKPLLYPLALNRDIELIQTANG